MEASHGSLEVETWLTCRGHGRPLLSSVRAVHLSQQYKPLYRHDHRRSRPDWVSAVLMLVR